MSRRHRRVDRRSRRSARSLVAVALVLAGSFAVTACDDADAPLTCVCTEEFRTIPLELTRPDGRPAEGAAVRVELAGSGAVLVEEAVEFQPGSYAVVSDALLDEVAVAGTPIRIVANLEGLSFETIWVVGKDPCGCHVELREGDRSGVMGADGTG